jgi:hypothetical protein
MEILDANDITKNVIPEWLKFQKRVERSKCLAELRKAVVVLNENSFESNTPVYEG